jgi:hypothetical protein
MDANMMKMAQEMMVGRWGRREAIDLARGQLAAWQSLLLLLAPQWTGGGPPIGLAPELPGVRTGA